MHQFFFPLIDIESEQIHNGKIFHYSFIDYRAVMKSGKKYVGAATGDELN